MRLRFPLRAHDTVVLLAGHEQIQLLDAEQRSGIFGEVVGISWGQLAAAHVDGGLESRYAGGELALGEDERAQVDVPTTASLILVGLAAERVTVGRIQRRGVVPPGSKQRRFSRLIRHMKERGAAVVQAAQPT